MLRLSNRDSIVDMIFQSWYGSTRNIDILKYDFYSKIGATAGIWTRDVGLEGQNLSRLDHGRRPTNWTEEVKTLSQIDRNHDLLL